MTGYLHDPCCFSAHDSQGHPEKSGRLAMVLAAENMPFIPFRPASDQELLLVHTADHLQRLKTQCEDGGGMLDADTYCCPESELVARDTVGGLIDLCLGVLHGSHSNGLALVRPPGHHATANQAMGFCLFNNVAVAAAVLLGQGVSRVAIVDFDVHHGNGTQDIFYDDDSVLYLSSHQYPHYPGSGAASEKGSGKGLGFTFNHPLDAGSGDKEFLAAYNDILLPALGSFAPEFILVSAGFDAHQKDPLAGLNVSTSGFATLIRQLVLTAGNLCDGKIVFSLEGGYHPQALGHCVDATVEILSTGGKFE